MMSYQAAAGRYEHMPYRRCGSSGLQLPLVSLGLWQNFGDHRAFDELQEILTRAFDLGITHFDVANNYGPPNGAAEQVLARALNGPLAPFRDELVISTKAGYEMWPGPYGDGGSRKYLLSSLDASLQRLELDYVDIFYSHRWDPETPLEETMGALDTAVRQGKALYAGISSYPPEQTEAAASILSEMGTPLRIHQPAYSMMSRWIETGLLEVFGRLQIGCIVFMPLAQGILTDRYLEGIPPGSRASRSDTLGPAQLDDHVMAAVGALREIAHRRGQTMAQLALAWTLRDPRVTSTLIGASSVAQLEENVATVERLDFDAEDLAEIDQVLTRPTA